MTIITNERYEALNTALRKHLYETGVEITTLPTKTREPKQFGVNWASMGTKNIEDTMKFATSLEQAAKIAAVLNAMEIKVEWVDDDPMIQTKEDYNRVVRGLENALEINALGTAIEKLAYTK